METLVPGMTSSSQGTEEIYQCGVCGIQGLSSYQLYTHRQHHEESTLYQCKQCAMGFASQAALDGHCATHQQGNQCFFCGAKHYSEDPKKLHHCVNITDKGFECTLCREVFSHTQQLQNHFLVQHQTSKWTGDGISEGGENGIPFGFSNTSGNRISGDNGSFANTEELQCKTGGEVFQEKCELYQHVTNPENDGVYSCSICKRTFARAGDLNKHEESHQWVRAEIWKFLSRSGNECSVCNSVFSGGVELEAHYQQHVINGSTYRCLECLTEFAGEDNVLSLLYHMVTNHHKKTPFQCRECGKCCPDKVKLGRHLSSHNPSKELSCNICHMVFTRQYRLNIHMNKHTGDEPYKCSECDKSFQSPRNLARHKRCHTGKSFDCDICHQVLNDKCAMLDHKARVHSGPDLINCEECGIPFSSKMYLSVHMRNVHGFTEKDRPTMHQCSVCKKYFKTASSLMSHFKTHSSAKHTCEICHRGFISAHNLQQHFRIHLSPTGEFTTENYRKCSYCNKEFGSRKQLAKHMVTHTKEKPHVCTVCGRQYGLKATLAKHMVSHHMSEEDIKAVLNCEVCGTRCFSTEELDQHLSTHTLSEDHVCVECGDKFFRSKELKEHRKLMHGQQRTTGHHRTYPTQDGLRKGSSERELVYLPQSGIVFKKNENEEGRHRESCRDPGAKFPRLSSEDDTMMPEKMAMENCQGSVTKLPTSSEDEIKQRKSNSESRQDDRQAGPDVVQVECTKAISDELGPRSTGNMSSFLGIKIGDTEFPQNNKEVMSSSDPMSDDNVMVVDHNHLQKEFLLYDGKSSQTSKTCSDCNKSFASLLELRRHTSRVHSTRTVEALPRCSLCGVCFRDEEYLQTHIKVHTAYVPVKQEKNREEHVSLGKVDGKSYKCNVGKDDGKAYKCSVCDKMFEKSSLLECHVKIHTSEEGTAPLWRFHLVDTAETQLYVCVHVRNNTALSCHQSYDSL